MRYSIIHHDVREKFQLTVAECIVFDSISKLSRLGENGTTHKPNKEIGEFIGFDEKTIRRAKKVGVEKGLLFEKLGGYGTTKKWEKSVTFTNGQNVRSTDKMSDKSGQNAEHTIYNKGNTTEQSSDITYEPINDDEPEKKIRGKKENYSKSYEELCVWAEERRGFKFMRRGKQYDSLKTARLGKISKQRLKDRWCELEGEDFYKEKGLDWVLVVSSFDKKA